MSEIKEVNNDYSEIFPVDGSLGGNAYGDLDSSASTLIQRMGLAALAKAAPLLIVGGLMVGSASGITPNVFSFFTEEANNPNNPGGPGSTSGQIVEVIEENNEEEPALTISADFSVESYHDEYVFGTLSLSGTLIENGATDIVISDAYVILDDGSHFSIIDSVSYDENDLSVSLGVSSDLLIKGNTYTVVLAFDYMLDEIPGTLIASDSFTVGLAYEEPEFTLSSSFAASKYVSAGDHQYYAYGSLAVNGELTVNDAEDISISDAYVTLADGSTLSLMDSISLSDESISGSKTISSNLLLTDASYTVTVVVEYTLDEEVKTLTGTSTFSIDQVFVDPTFSLSSGFTASSYDKQDSGVTYALGSLSVNGTLVLNDAENVKLSSLTIAVNNGVISLLNSANSTTSGFTVSSSIPTGLLLADNSYTVTAVYSYELDGEEKTISATSTFATGSAPAEEEPVVVESKAPSISLSATFAEEESYMTENGGVVTGTVTLSGTLTANDATDITLSEAYMTYPDDTKYSLMDEITTSNGSISMSFDAEELKAETTYPITLVYQYTLNDASSTLTGSASFTTGTVTITEPTLSLTAEFDTQEKYAGKVSGGLSLSGEITVNDGENFTINKVSIAADTEIEITEEVVLEGITISTEEIFLENLTPNTTYTVTVVVDYDTFGTSKTLTETVDFTTGDIEFAEPTIDLTLGYTNRGKENGVVFGWLSVENCAITENDGSDFTLTSATYTVDKEERDITDLFTIEYDEDTNSYSMYMMENTQEELAPNTTYTVNFEIAYLLAGEDATLETSATFTSGDVEYTDPTFDFESDFETLSKTDGKVAGNLTIDGTITANDADSFTINKASYQLDGTEVTISADSMTISDDAITISATNLTGLAPDTEYTCTIVVDYKVHGEDGSSTETVTFTTGNIYIDPTATISASFEATNKTDGKITGTLTLEETIVENDAEEIEITSATYQLTGGTSTTIENATGLSDGVELSGLEPDTEYELTVTYSYTLDGEAKTLEATTTFDSGNFFLDPTGKIVIDSARTDSKSDGKVDVRLTMSSALITVNDATDITMTKAVAVADGDEIDVSEYVEYSEADQSIYIMDATIWVDEATPDTEYELQLVFEYTKNGETKQLILSDTFDSGNIFVEPEITDLTATFTSVGKNSDDGLVYGSLELSGKVVTNDATNLILTSATIEQETQSIDVKSLVTVATDGSLSFEAVSLSGFTGEARYPLNLVFTYSSFTDTDLTLEKTVYFNVDEVYILPEVTGFEVSFEPGEGDAEFVEGELTFNQNVTVSINDATSMELTAAYVTVDGEQVSFIDDVYYDKTNQILYLGNETGNRYDGYGSWIGTTMNTNTDYTATLEFTYTLNGTENVLRVNSEFNSGKIPVESEVEITSITFVAGEKAETDTPGDTEPSEDTESSESSEESESDDLTYIYGTLSATANLTANDGTDPVVTKVVITDSDDGSSRTFENPEATIEGTTITITGIDFTRSPLIAGKEYELTLYVDNTVGENTYTATDEDVFTPMSVIDATVSFNATELTDGDIALGNLVIDVDVLAANPDNVTFDADEITAGGYLLVRNATQADDYNADIHHYSYDVTTGLSLVDGQTYTVRIPYSYADDNVQFRGSIQRKFTVDYPIWIGTATYNVTESNEVEISFTFEVHNITVDSYDVVWVSTSADSSGPSNVNVTWMTPAKTNGTSTTYVMNGIAKPNADTDIVLAPGTYTNYMSVQIVSGTTTYNLKTEETEITVE